MTLEKALKKFQKQVAKKEFCTLRIIIHTDGKDSKPTIRWDGYIHNKTWTKEHINLDNVIKELKEYRKTKKYNKGVDVIV